MSATFQSSAPGRLDVMGGFADYSGSLVLQMPIHEKTTVSVRLRADNICTVESKTKEGWSLKASLTLEDIVKQGVVDYAGANAFFRKHTDLIWTAYVVGCGLVLKKERAVDFRGADFEIASDVPLGKGVSSSASLEVATMKALANAFDVAVHGTELPTLAQKVENLVVGAPCGLMDQLASHFGEPGKLLPIVCQPDRLLPTVPIPGDLKFVGIDSGVRHSVGGTSYSDVRCAAYMGYSIIAHHLGTTVEQISHARRSGDRSALPYNGYLCNITVPEFEKCFAPILPQMITGGAFIEKYGTTIDPVTNIHIEDPYLVAACSAHPIAEQGRVSEFMSILRQPLITDLHCKRLGTLMQLSHEGYSRCGLGSQRTDEIVDLARSFSDDGVFGAKITGGGSGGTVCLLVRGEAGIRSARKIHKALCAKYAQDLAFFE